MCRVFRFEVTILVGREAECFRVQVSSSQAWLGRKRKDCLVEVLVVSSTEDMEDAEGGPGSARDRTQRQNQEQQPRTGVSALQAFSHSSQKLAWVGHPGRCRRGNEDPSLRLG